MLTPVETKQLIEWKNRFDPNANHASNYPRFTFLQQTLGKLSATVSLFTNPAREHTTDPNRMNASEDSCVVEGQ